MNVIVFASRKGGSGKSTLTAHLAAHANRPSRRCMLIDCDPQGSISLWHRLRGTAEPQLRNGTRGGVKEIVEQARADGVEWAFVDTPPNMSGMATDAISEATLVVIPVRLAVFDLAAVKETIDFARQSKKPFALVINAVPARRDNTESPFVTQVREVLAGLNVPVWAGQITHRT
ncbi:MAG: chromosome partitioning protein, partial [Hyphomicrobiales bacterium]|nr:chromosome partitioning protein [Hyphomicrobiales bacterium]